LKKNKEDMSFVVEIGFENILDDLLYEQILKMDFEISSSACFFPSFRRGGSS
jgi:hypothetical protein